MFLAGFQKLDRKVLRIVHHEYVLPMKNLWFPLAAKSKFWASGWFFVWPGPFEDIGVHVRGSNKNCEDHFC